MIRGLVNGSINPALRPHLQRPIKLTPPTMVVDGRPLHDVDRPGAVARAAAAILPLLSHPVVHPIAVAAEGEGRRPRRMNPDGLRRQMDLLAQDAHKRTAGRGSAHDSPYFVAHQ